MSSSGKLRVGISSDFLSPDHKKGDKLILKFSSVDLSPLETNPDVELEVVEVKDGRIPAESVVDIDALILLAAKFDKESIPASESQRLRLIARFGVGYDSVDVGACSERGIAVTITPDGVRRPVATSILTFILALSTKLITKNRLGRLGAEGFEKRAGAMGEGLVGKTLGSLGMGNIGAEMFRLCAPLGMKFVAYDPYADKTSASQLGVELLEEKESVFKQSDFLAINCPLLPATKHIVNAESLSLMKPTAYVINTSRGGTVDQKALVAALKGNIIAGAALDVFDPEPPATDDELFSLGEKVITTPHSICWTDECFHGIGKSAIEACLALLQGNIPTTLVDRSVVKNQQFQDALVAFNSLNSATKSLTSSENGKLPRATHNPNTGDIRPNRIKQVLAAGKPAFVACGELNWTANSIDALLASSPQFDGVWLEGEHGPLDYGDIGNLTRACDIWGATALARVQKSCDQVDENIIYRHLDCGVQGVIVPHVNTKEEAETVVAACKFKTEKFLNGRRGMFVSRQGYGVKDYFMKANDSTLSVILLEDIKAYENLDSILTVDGIDVFFVAYADLAQSMGYLHDLGNSEVQKVMRSMLERIIAAGKVAGSTPTSPEQAVEHYKLGVRFFYIQPLSIAATAIQNYLKEMST
eukprot:m.343357 g.343357  ORF g.343357 m.343357 type:complete len:645 (-) comp22718_c0_seq1:1458-3392(-)